MSTESMASEITEHNLSYLMLAQKLLLEDKESGAFKLGVSAEIADVILSLSVPQLIELSKADQLITRLAFNSCDQLKALAFKRRDSGLNPIHTALLLTSQPLSE